MPPAAPGAALIRRAPFGLIALLMAVMGGLCFVSASMLWDLRAGAWSAAVIASRNVVTAEGSEIDQALRIYDASLRSAASAIREPDVASAAPALRRRALFGRLLDPTLLGPIRILDADGRLVADSASADPAAASRAELAAFDGWRDHPGSGLAIGPPQALGSGDHVVTLSRRIEGPDGRFAGIVCGTIRLGALTERFRTLRLGAHDVISLFSADGVMLAHAPGDPMVGRRITGSEVMRHFDAARSGTFTAPAALDGVQRVFVFAHLPGWPMLIDVGVSTDDLFAVWRGRALAIGFVLATMLLCGGTSILALRREIASRGSAEAAALRSEARTRALADSVSDVIFRFDPDLRRTYASPSVSAYGYDPAELLGQLPKAWIHPEDWPIFDAMVADLQAGHPSEATCYRVRRKDGEHRWVEARLNMLEDGEIVAILRDVDGRKRVEFEQEAARTELAGLVAADPLTGLGNRRALDAALEEALRRGVREDQDVSLLLIDIDRFKQFNDRYGHLEGDAALRTVAGALARVTRRSGDLAVRFGGEEFVLVLPDTDLFGAISVADRLRERVLEAAIRHEDAELGMVSVSVGVASGRPSRHGCTPDALLAKADEALYAAKHAGRNVVRALTLTESAPVA